MDKQVESQLGLTVLYVNTFARNRKYSFVYSTIAQKHGITHTSNHHLNLSPPVHFTCTKKTNYQLSRSLTRCLNAQLFVTDFLFVLFMSCTTGYISCASPTIPCSCKLLVLRRMFPAEKSSFCK